MQGPRDLDQYVSYVQEAEIVSIKASSVVNAPLEEVYAWHERPGALPRLLPPWQPLRVVQEASSLSDGRAVLSLPGGIKWVACHRECEPPGRFVDELSSLPLRWRHEHRFEAVGDGRTRVIDEVTTRVPAALLRSTFAYRHRQLAADLASHAGARRLNANPLTIAVTGSSGLIGSALVAFLSTGGHRVVRLVRHETSDPDSRTWSPEDPDPKLLEGIDALVHLAGEPIAGRFSEAHKRDVYDSRFGPTRRLAQLVAATDGATKVMVTASAIGVYGFDRGDEILDERAQRGAGFLADVVAGWESATAPASEAGMRVAMVRTGIVQSPRGGALRLLLPLYRAGLGGPLGDGSAWMSWIGLDDLLDVYLRALVDDRFSGPINAVAPNPVRGDEYARTLGRTLRRPAWLRVPSFGPRLLLGAEGAREVALASQRVVPDRLLGLGHRFRHPHLAGALAHQLGKEQLPVDLPPTSQQ